MTVLANSRTLDATMVPTRDAWEDAMSLPPRSAPISAATSRYLLERRRARRLAPTSVKNYRNTYAWFADSVGRNKPVSLIKRKDVERFLARPLSPSSARNQLSALRMFFAWAVVNGYTKADPTTGIESPREPRRLPRGMKQRDVASIFPQCADDRDVVMVLLMCQEGLRAIEVARAQVGDIDVSERTILIHGKGGHERILPISDETWCALETYLGGVGTAPAGPLVRSKNDGHSPISSPLVQERVRAAMKAAGVGGQPHRLRHTCAHGMLDNGATVRDVQVALGHASLQTTQIYLPAKTGAQLRGVMGGRRYRSGLGA